MTLISFENRASRTPNIIRIESEPRLSADLVGKLVSVHTQGYQPSCDPPQGHGLDAARCGELLSIKTARGMLDQIQRLRGEFDIIGEMRERLIIAESKRKKSPRAKLLNLLDAKGGDIV